jgi:nitrate/nitrite-specific signal transduction histidine kinase
MLPAMHRNALIVRLVFAAGPLSIEIEDEGVGFSTGAEQYLGYGIKNMHSRIQQLGGEMTIWSSPGQGTCVYLPVFHCRVVIRRCCMDNVQSHITTIDRG